MKVFLTKDGVNHVKTELINIQKVLLPKAEQRLKEAKSYGDEAEIKDAKAERDFYIQRIIHLDTMLTEAKIIG